MNWLRENWFTLIIVLASSIITFFVASHFSNKKIQKIQDWLIEAFGLVFTLFMCSIALQLAFGIMLLLAEIFNGLGNWFMDLSVFVRYPLNLITGIILTIWLYKKRNTGKNL